MNPNKQLEKGRHLVRKYRKEFLMIRLQNITVLGAVLTLTLGGVGMSLASSDLRPLPMMISDLERHIAELQINISKIENRIVYLKEVPTTTDPLIQQLRDLDLKGWTLHEEQWKHQLDHLRIAEDLLKEVEKAGQGKLPLLKKWEGHRQQYEEDLKAYRMQRHRIEEQRLQVEGKMIGRYLQ